MGDLILGLVVVFPEPWLLYIALLLVPITFLLGILTSRVLLKSWVCQLLRWNGETSDGNTGRAKSLINCICQLHWIQKRKRSTHITVPSVSYLHRSILIKEQNPTYNCVLTNSKCIIQMHSQAPAQVIIVMSFENTVYTFKENIITNNLSYQVYLHLRPTRSWSSTTTNN